MRSQDWHGGHQMPKTQDLSASCGEIQGGKQSRRCGNWTTSKNSATEPWAVTGKGHTLDIYWTGNHSQEWKHIYLICLWSIAWNLVKGNTLENGRRGVLFKLPSCPILLIGKSKWEPQRTWEWNIFRKTRSIKWEKHKHLINKQLSVLKREEM